MFIDLFPRAHARFLKLPLLGGFLEALAQWLAAKGFAPAAIRRRICKAPVLEQMLTSLAIRDRGGLSQEQFLALAPRPARNQPDLSALVRSMAACLAGSSLWRVVDPTPSELLVRAYLEFLRQVRGLVDSTTNHHRRTALGLLAFVGISRRTTPARPALGIRAGVPGGDRSHHHARTARLGHVSAAGHLRLARERSRRLAVGLHPLAERSDSSQPAQVPPATGGNPTRMASRPLV